MTICRFGISWLTFPTCANWTPSSQISISSRYFEFGGFSSHHKNIWTYSTLKYQESIDPRRKHNGKEAWKYKVNIIPFLKVFNFAQYSPIWLYEVRTLSRCATGNCMRRCRCFQTVPQQSLQFIRTHTLRSTPPMKIQFCNNNKAIQKIQISWHRACFHSLLRKYLLKMICWKFFLVPVRF